MSYPRWRIRRRASRWKPWVVTHPSLKHPKGFDTFEEARRFVLDGSRDETIAREVTHLRRLMPRRSA